MPYGLYAARLYARDWLQRAIPIVLHLALRLRKERLTVVLKMVAA